MARVNARPRLKQTGNAGADNFGAPGMGIDLEVEVLS
jgi:hypothetical protein